MSQKPGDDRAGLVQGQGRYTADLDQAGALHAVFIRSDRAHARILGIDADAARDMPGIVGVYGAADLGPFGTFPAFLRYADRDGHPLKAPGRPPIAGDMVRHAGEIIAVIVAERHAQAVDAADAVMIEMEALPAIVGLDAAFAKNAALVHEDVAGNLAIAVEAGDSSAMQLALAGSTHVVDLTVELPRLVPTPLEPRSALARYEDGRFILHAPHQGAPEVRRDLSHVLKVNEDAIDVLAGHVGGAFGARGPAYPEHALLLDLARRLGRPMRWQGTRLEAFLSDHHGRGTRLTGRLGLDAKGRFTALDVRYEADLGAYVTPVGAHINVHNPLQTLTGAYRIPVASALFRLAFSNTVPTGPYRGAGRPDIAFLIERLVDEAARRTGIDRIALRRRNLIPSSAFPYRTPGGSTYDSGDYRAMLGMAQDAIDWRGAPARARAARRKGLLHGIGLSLFVEVAGGGPVAHDEVRLSVERQDDGLNRIVIETLAQSTGQSHAQTFSQLAADELGIDTARIVWRPVAQGLAGAGAFASRATSTVGSALLSACKALRDIANGDVAAMLADDAKAAALSPVSATAASSLTFPSGCHAAEVTIDPSTGIVTLARYVAVDDAGRVLSAPVVHGQIHGGVAQGFGGAVLERAVFDDDGQLLTSSFMDYGLPRAGDLPPIETQTIEVPSPNNPLGVKGVGEAGTTGGLGAVANAVTHALASVGAGPLDIPFTPERVWRALQEAGL